MVAQGLMQFIGLIATNIFAQSQKIACSDEVCLQTFA